MEQEIKVYNFVRANAGEYLSTIIRAVVDETKEENRRLREQKAKVECGLVALLDKVKLQKLSKSMKLTLQDCLENCTFVVMDKRIEELKVE